jgi:hypothetical protein
MHPNAANSAAKCMHSNNNCIDTCCTESQVIYTYIIYKYGTLQTTDGIQVYNIIGKV